MPSLFIYVSGRNCCEIQETGNQVDQQIDNPEITFFRSLVTHCLASEKSISVSLKGAHQRVTRAVPLLYY